MLDFPLTCTVPEAGKRLGIGRSSAYQAAANGEIPTIRIGRLVLVPIAALERLVQQAGSAPEAAA